MCPPRCHLTLRSTKGDIKISSKGGPPQDGPIRCSKSYLGPRGWRRCLDVVGIGGDGNPQRGRWRLADAWPDQPLIVTRGGPELVIKLAYSPKFPKRLILVTLAIISSFPGVMLPTNERRPTPLNSTCRETTSFHLGYDNWFARFWRWNGKDISRYWKFLGRQPVVLFL